MMFSRNFMPEGGSALTAHRPVITSRRGMVACAHYEASLAGLRMFLQGGNAVDAAVAAAAALNVVEPFMSGLGGIGFLLISRNHGQERRVLNFSGVVPQQAVPEKFTPENHSVGVRCPLVPGNPHGWLTMLDTYGSLSREAALAPAIELAEQGIVISSSDSRYFEVNEGRLAQFPTSKEAYFPNGGSPQPGYILKQPNLAQSFKTLAAEGLDGFYRGAVAQEIDRFMRETDGLITAEDLDTYEPNWETPISTTYKGFEVVTTGPNSNAFQVLETLNILEAFDLRSMGHNSADYIHLVSEAIKVAVPDRIAYGGDPNFMEVPVAGLLTKEYARGRRGLINHKRASTVIGERYTQNPPEDAIPAGTPSVYTSGETTHFSAADSEGTVASITQTLGAGFRLRRGGGQHRNSAKQQHRPDGHRWGQRQPSACSAGQASGKQHGAHTGVQGRKIHPLHRYARQLRHSPDDNPDGLERAGVRHERAGGHRGGAIPRDDGRDHQHGGAGVPGGA